MTVPHPPRRPEMDHPDADHPDQDTETDPDVASSTPLPVRRVVVGLEDDASDAAVAAAMSAAGVDGPRVLFAGVLIGECAADDALLTRLRRLPGVRYAEWDRIEIL